MAGSKFNPNEIYDLTPSEREVLEARQKLRSELKKEFQKKATNPYRGVGGYIFDPAVQRFLSMKAHHYDMFKPTPKNFAFAFFGMFLPITLLAWRMEKDRVTRDEKCRRGEIAYKDRSWKFV